MNNRQHRDFKRDPNAIKFVPIPRTAGPFAELERRAGWSPAIRKSTRLTVVKFIISARRAARGAVKSRGRLGSMFEERSRTPPGLRATVSSSTLSEIREAGGAFDRRRCARARACTSACARVRCSQMRETYRFVSRTSARIVNLCASSERPGAG